MIIVRNRNVFYASLVAIIVNSCISDDVFFNHEAGPPEEQILNVDHLKQGQHVDGMLSFTFSPESNSSIMGVVVFVDSVVVQQLYNSPYHIEINTRQWPEGSHRIDIGLVKEKAPEIGMLSLIGFPYKLYTIDLVFDRTPPTGVTLLKAEWDDTMHSPVLTWTKNNDPNFYAYIIYRQDKSTIYEAGRVYNQDQLSMADTWNNGAIGFTVTYYIEVSNRFQSLQSNPIILSYPSQINAAPESLSSFIHPIISKTRPELYVLETHAVKALSTLSNQVTRSYPMDFKYPVSFAISQDESKLYVVSTYSPKLTVLDASTFDVIYTTDFNFNASSIVCGREDRLYLSTSWPFEGPVKIVDANNGNEIGDVGIHAPNGLLAISSDNNTLYVANPSANLYQDAQIYKVNITTDNPQTLLTKNASDWVRGIQLSEDDQKLFVLHDVDYPAPLNNFVDCWDVSSLTSIKKYYVPNQAFDFSVNATSIFIISGERTLQYFPPGEVYEYAISTNQVINTWKFIHAPKLVQASADNTVLYVYGDSFWRLNL
jgi:hypothetical protein